MNEWRMLPRLSLSLGLRWDLYPPPSVSGAQMFTYTGDVNKPSSLGLSAQGAPLYKTTYTNFAPRVGVAWVISNQPGRELVLRVGGGLFHDGISISQTFGAGYGLGSAVTSTYSSKPQGVFPLMAADILIPVTIPSRAPYSFTYYPDPHIAPPSILQWSASIEQALGSKQSFSLGYVASTGRKLSTLKEYSLSKLNPLFGTIDQYENGPGSSYNSMQLQYKRQALRVLQVITSYTWSHAIDWASTDYYSADMPLQHGTPTMTCVITSQRRWFITCRRTTQTVGSTLFWATGMQICGWLLARPSTMNRPVRPSPIRRPETYLWSLELQRSFSVRVRAGYSRRQTDQFCSL
jgi:TonB dependent receptor